MLPKNEDIPIPHASIGNNRCRCPRCGYVMYRRRDIICEHIPCPRCGTMMQTTN